VAGGGRQPGRQPDRAAPARRRPPDREPGHHDRRQAHADHPEPGQVQAPDKHGAKVVEFHLNQLFSTEDDLKFESEEHFLEALVYDIENKTTEGEHNLQEQYMTLYGWKRRRDRAAKGGDDDSSSSRKKAPPKAPVKQAKGQAKEEEDAPVLKIYRTMKEVNWKRLEAKDNTALTGHLGDFKQAHRYLHRRSPEPKVLVEFTLKRGAERALFSPSTMAFPNVPGPLKVPNIMQETLKAEGAKGSFALASPNEGLAEGKVGIKSEGGESGFSFGIGGGDSAEVFMKLVASAKVIGHSVIDLTAAPEEDDMDANPASEGEKPASQNGDKPQGEKPAADPHRERNARMQQFLQALAQVPVAEADPEDSLVEAADPSNQYVAHNEDGKQDKGKEPAKTQAYEASRLVRKANPGGGDCLFHAIAGRTLSEAELLLLRQNIAAMRGGMPENQALNANQAVAALTQTSVEYADLMTGRHALSNQVYALLQAVPGIYAGEDELLQWCMRGQGKRVVVLDSTLPLGNGALAVYTAAGRQVVPVTAENLYDSARQAAAGATLVLFKTAGHWERVDAIN
jgi:hypothetical protein